MPQLSNPDMKTALGDAPYTVAPDGNAQITTKDTNQTVEIVKAEVVKTNDGIATGVKLVYDKDGNQYFFATGLDKDGKPTDVGWFKKIEITSGMQIPAAYVENQAALNTLFSLNYNENPTISPNAVDPHYYVNVDVNNIRINFQSEGSTKDQFRPVDTKFAKATQPFTEPIVLNYVDSQGQEFFILVRTMKNPTSENKNQLINMFYWISKSRYDVLSNLPEDYMMNLKNIIKKNTFDIAPVLISPEEINGIQIPWDPNNWQGMDKFKDPQVAGMQTRGDLLSFLPLQDQVDIDSMMAFWYGGPAFGNGHIFTESLDHIPEQFALKRLLPDFQNWFDAPSQ